MLDTLNLSTHPRLFDLFINASLVSNFFGYRPIHNIHITVGNYELLTATKWSDLYQAFKLRYKCFKMNGSEPLLPFCLDIDEHDLFCDHLIIKDKRTKKIVGTYRLISSERTDRFYTETEFHLQEFLRTPGKKLELGRACIDPQFRNGAVIDLLWKGIALYVKKINARYLFGCTSVFLEKGIDISSVHAYLLSEKWVKTDYDITPQLNYAVAIDPHQAPMEANQAKAILPPLLRSYLKVGASIYGEPAYDPDFKSYDYVTILDLDEITPIYLNRYFSEIGEQ